MGEFGSRIILEDVYRLRIACTDADSTLQQFATYPRTAGFPGVNEIVSWPNICFRGTCYTESVQSIDFVTQVQPSDPEASQFSGGYTLMTFNASRLCMHVVDPSCLQTSTADACVSRLADRHLNPQEASGVNPVVVAVPVVVGMSLLHNIKGGVSTHKLPCAQSTALLPACFA